MSREDELKRAKELEQRFGAEQLTKEWTAMAEQGRRNHLAWRSRGRTLGLVTAVVTFVGITLWMAFADPR